MRARPALSVVLPRHCGACEKSFAPLVPLADVNVIGSIDKSSVVIQEHHAFCGLVGDSARSHSVACRVRTELDTKAKIAQVELGKCSLMDLKTK